MARRKTERLVNLTILLLSSRRFVPKEQIRATVEGYRDSSPEAFMRMFVQDVQESNLASIAGSIFYKIITPYMILMLCSQTDAAAIC